MLLFVVVVVVFDDDDDDLSSSSSSSLSLPSLFLLSSLSKDLKISWTVKRRTKSHNTHAKDDEREGEGKR
ncbi:hypothetical protein OAV88_01255 [bacterium]|nr:hypothetical protein [bacterium]